MMEALIWSNAHGKDTESLKSATGYDIKESKQLTADQLLNSPALIPGTAI